MVTIGEEGKPETVKEKWINRERIMVLCSRGVSFRDRHLMKDLLALMPHAKTESKIDKKQNLLELNEICEMRNCTKCVYFEARKKKDVFLWIANSPRGPSAKFLVSNVHTKDELKLAGNCLKGSRPLLSFDKSFDQVEHYSILKELLVQIFGTPNHHPLSQPFFDHVFNFSIFDGRIWIRNYQIVDETEAQLEEIGPRLVLQPIKIFDGSFSGAVLYENADYVPPNRLRNIHTAELGLKYGDRSLAKKGLKDRREKSKSSFKVDETDEIFNVPKEEPVLPAPKKRKIDAQMIAVRKRTRRKK